MAATSLKKPGNKLGAKTTYQLFLEREEVPAIRAFHVEDIRNVELYPWARIGGRGVYLNLEGTEGVNDCYICEAAPGEALEPQKHMFEELIFVISGRGATTVWRDGGKKQTFEWSEGALFSPPLNTWHQHFNGQGDKLVRLLAMTNGPTVLNLFHNIDFVFNCDYPFTDRYNGEEDFFSGNANIPAEGFSDTNFIRDVRSFELLERKDRGAGGRMIMIEMANNVMSAHISQFPVGTYKKAHRHGAGAHVIILRGEGFSVVAGRKRHPALQLASGQSPGAAGAMVSPAFQHRRRAREISGVKTVQQPQVSRTEKAVGHFRKRENRRRSDRIRR
jgi:mannose-6-phosphate isomerase-like protein (cupin superfamily)